MNEKIAAPRPALAPRNPGKTTAAHTISFLQRPLVALVLALSSATTVGVGAYPENRAERNQGVDEAVDRLYYTVATLITGHTDVSPSTTKEKLCWIIGVIGLWGSVGVGLSGLLTRAKELADEWMKEKPMTETKFLLDNQPSHQQLMRLLAMNGYLESREITTLYFRDRGDGTEVKLQLIGNRDSPSEVKMRTKIQSGDGDNVISTHVFDDRIFGKLLFDQWASEDSTTTTHKVRMSKRGKGGRDTHVDFYDEEEVVLVEVVQQASDGIPAESRLPTYLQPHVKGRIPVKDRDVPGKGFDDLIELVEKETDESDV